MENTTKSTMTLLVRANYQLQSTVFQRSPPWAVHFHQQWTRTCMPWSLTICTTRGDPLLLLLKCTTHCLVVISASGWSPSTFSKSQWMSMGAIFSTWGNSIPPLCFLCTFLSHTILSDCPSAAICHTATCYGMGYLQEGSASTAIPPISASAIVSKHHKVGDSTFRVT